MESWRMTWRKGIAPILTDRALELLIEGLFDDDPRIIQGLTTQPPPWGLTRGWRVEAACVLGYCGWQAEKLESVADVEEFFAGMCFEIDQRLGEPAGCRRFLNWFDETPRDKMRRELIAECELALSSR